MSNLPCVVKGCYKRSSTGSRCEEHTVIGYQSNRRERLPADWRALSTYILIRDNYLCYICKDDTVKADAVDHIIPGDNHSPDNLAAVHHHTGPKCHLYKTADEGNQAKKDNRAQTWGWYWLQEYNRMKLDESIRPPF